MGFDQGAVSLVRNCRLRGRRAKRGPLLGASVHDLITVVGVP